MGGVEGGDAHHIHTSSPALPYGSQWYTSIVCMCSLAYLFEFLSIATDILDYNTYYTFRHYNTLDQDQKYSPAQQILHTNCVCSTDVDIQYV